MSTFNSISDPDESNLFPVLPSAIRDSRNIETMRVRISRTIVPWQRSATASGASVASVPSHQPQGWTISTRLEKRRRAHTRITIVTEARNMDSEPGVTDQLNAWLAVVRNVTAEKHIHLPETSHLFLEIHQDLGTCNYYFVDHFLRTVFWLHTLDMWAKSSHPEHSLQENYWIHVGLFPESASNYSAAALNELRIVLLHAREDAFTLMSPTFPYTDEECGWSIYILKLIEDHTSSPQTTTYVARSWVTIKSHRSFIHFDSKRSFILTAVSKMLLFGLPDEHRACFESLCVDQLIYTSRWHEHVSQTIGDLKQEILRILALLSANILMTQIPSFPTLTKLSSILCVLGLTVALFLLQEQRRLVCTKATTSLDDLVTSYGFQPVAIVHSLPQALFVWALLLFAIQYFWMTFYGVSLTSLSTCSFCAACGMCGHADNH
ncbi:hypothetical protein EDB84DRAFT_1578763 [Lactarius hengduanensis]|nr:hypothetical protein EDB84DRAFT_1578763 [Lactarius hengduanensis]